MRPDADRAAVSAAFRVCSSTPLSNQLHDVGDGFGARPCAEIAFAVDTDAHGVGFHVALSDYKHGVHFHLLGALDFAVDLF